MDKKQAWCGLLFYLAMEQFSIPLGKPPLPARYHDWYRHHMLFILAIFV
jgi:hypothetical protein